MSHSSRLPLALLLALMLAYAGYFSWYTLNRHNTLNSYAADLSLIDQPMWNTARGPGTFMEQTWGDRQQPRLAEHFEPILVPLSLLFFLWDDVRVQLIAQTLALALGALPVFWIARHQLSLTSAPLPTSPRRGEEHSFPSVGGNEGGQKHPPPATRHPQFTIHHSPFTIYHYIPLAFAAVFLLSPHLQAANIADFHADPFVVAPLLFAFWTASRQRWGWMWLWAAVAMLTKETLPTLTGMLGLWLLLAGYFPALAGASPPPRRDAARHGLGLMLVSGLWFGIATFGVVAPLARQYFGTDGPIYLANRFSGESSPLALLLEPARWRYLLGLLAAFGFLPLLAPEMLLLGLPVLAANMLSNFPGQYSGEQHYSAPLVAVIAIAAIFGTRRLVNHCSLRESNGQTRQQTALLAVTLWLLAAALSFHTLHGWTPLSIRAEDYRPTPGSLALPALLPRIPPDAVVSASAGVHPHLAHRRVIYLFPITQGADSSVDKKIEIGGAPPQAPRPTGSFSQKATYLLIDVTDIPGAHPNDARAKLLSLLAAGWTVQAADSGLILATNTGAPPAPPCDAARPLPCDFYRFTAPTAPPATPTGISFGDDALRLLGFTLHDDPDDGVTVQFHWQAAAPLPADLRLWPLLFDDAGRLLNNPAQVPMVAPVWYPPQSWPTDEIIVTATLPQLLPDAFHLGLAVGPGETSLTTPDARWPVTITGGEVAPRPGNWAHLASFTRRGPFLTEHPPQLSLHPLTPIDAQFGPAIHLTGYWVDAAAARPGAELPLRLIWQASQPPAADYTVFLHLLAADGSRVAQTDAYPGWLTPQPTSRWSPHQPIPDSHTLPLRSDLPPGQYTLHLGLYDAVTLQRLPLPDGRDSLELAVITIE